MGELGQIPGMSAAEERLLRSLADCNRQFHDLTITPPSVVDDALASTSPTDLMEFSRGIRALERHVMARVVRRSLRAPGRGYGYPHSSVSSEIVPYDVPDR